jgi:demethylmenaquinone methyltransferase/2-methoxy-6-polyprenyl-1,4-benzoquinol methylase
MSPFETVPSQTPHAVLTDYYAREDERSSYLRRIFDETAEDYDRFEALLGLGSGHWYRHKTLQLAGLQPGMSVLDIGTGTGLVACAAVRIVGDPSHVVGVDPSVGMIRHARVPAGVRLLEGRAEAIPVADASADFLSMGYALRHLSDLTRAFREFHRVLRPGGRLCLLEITCPENAGLRALLKLHLRGLMPLAARWLARRRGTRELMRYYWDTIEACAAPAVILQALTAAGFDGVHRSVDLGIFSDYRARKPQ